MSTPFTTPQDPRIDELLDWMLLTGRLLPLPIDVILQFEDQGCVVDLDGNGDIYSEQGWLDHLAALIDEVAP